MKVLYISLAIIILDQITKFFVKGFSIPFLNINFQGMDLGESIPIINDFFRLTFVENPGMAFGIDFGLDFKIWLSIFTLVASLGILYYLFLVRHHSLTLRIPLAFILGGAIGNLIDRTFYGIFYGYAPLFYGKVVDFLDFDFFDFEIFGRAFDRWPVFNIADMSVTIGVILILLLYRKHEENKVENEITPTALSMDENNNTKETDNIPQEKIINENKN
ncbi:MAG: hypothetical protein STSR0008_16750 [Ignavibacterium sp.]